MQAECKGRHHSCDFFTVGKFKWVTEKLIIKKRKNKTTPPTYTHINTQVYNWWLNAVDIWDVDIGAGQANRQPTHEPTGQSPQWQPNGPPGPNDPPAGRTGTPGGLGLRLLQGAPWTWPIPPICPWSDLTARLVVTEMASRAKVSPWGGWAAWRGFVIPKLPAEQKAAEGY